MLELQVVTKYKNTIENKKTDAVSTKEKENAWNALATDFNSHANLARRDWKTLQLCYKNVKRRTKKSAADDKVSIHKTGGGPFVQPTVDEAGRKLVAALKPQLLPLACESNCDANFHQEVIFDVRECDVEDPALAMETAVNESQSQSVAFAEEIAVSGVSYNMEQVPDTDVSPGPTSRTSPPKKRRAEAEGSLRDNFYKRRLECLEAEHAKKNGKSQTRPGNSKI
ncbi:myb/SANT-like DNA-binding domain-containing protein 3 [Anabrus simplex]|uniref:myb/SANT-like DNA-binding domain-containing protein 3 n=1 Tax=Anabrus simplex TaxID=316456 RepID=UPI0035A2820E